MQLIGGMATASGHRKTYRYRLMRLYDTILFAKVTCKLQHLNVGEYDVTVLSLCFS